MGCIEVEQVKRNYSLGDGIPLLPGDEHACYQAVCHKFKTVHTSYIIPSTHVSYGCFKLFRRI